MNVTLIHERVQLSGCYVPASEPIDSLRRPFTVGREQQRLCMARAGRRARGAAHGRAGRVSDTTAFLYLGEFVELSATSQVFTNPKRRRTEEYVTRRFGCGLYRSCPSP